MSSRALLAVVGTSLLLVLAGCKKDPGEVAVCGEGVSCPRGARCAAGQPVCIYDSCGDGNVDPGEKCDDGGITDGDELEPGKHCSADCKSNESCGNGVWDYRAGERCDPTFAGWIGRCSDDCRSSLCGNHRVDPPYEDCDPGDNNVPLETLECDLDCTARMCGDGTVNRVAPAEQCDRNDDGVAGADGQSATCNFDCTASRCGDGKTNPLATTPAGGEQCDDGDHNGWEARCLPACIKNKCGDTHINKTYVDGKPVEDCDGGLSDASPRVDCPYRADGRSCTLCSVCKFVAGTPHYCGDGKTDSQSSSPPGNEACDLASRNGLTQSECLYGNRECELCSQDCRTQTMVAGPICGDSIVRGGMAPRWAVVFRGLRQLGLVLVRNVQLGVGRVAVPPRG